MPCEGKTLPVMIRMAKRYNDPTIISDLVCSKYSEENTAIAAKFVLRSKVATILFIGTLIAPLLLIN